jgi:PAS domain S-box-containing protein
MPLDSKLARLPTIPPLSWDHCRLLVESVVDYAIFMLDTQGYVATWNPGAERIKGYTPQEIVGQHFSKFYPEEDIAAHKPERELDVARELGRVEDEGWRIRKDGSRFWASVVITALRDGQGQLHGFGKVTRDLTSRRQSEERLRLSEQRFHHLVDAVIDYAIFMLDPAGHVSTWNPGARRVKGYTADEIIGRHFSVFYTPEDRAAGRPDKILAAVLRDGRYEDESWRVRNDGTRFWANVVITALRDERGNLLGFAKVTRDLTARRDAAEVERKLLREQTAREVAEAAERSLRDSEERHRLLSERLEIVLEGVADGITVEDREGRVVFANGAAARSWGYATATELLAATRSTFHERFEILDEEGRPFDPANLPARRALAGEPANDAVLHVRERGLWREWWAEVRASAVRDAGGTPQLAVNIWHDISAERRERLHARYLADATAALGSSLRYDEMLSLLAGVLVPGLADWCGVHLVEGDGLRDVSPAPASETAHALAADYQRRFVSGAPGDGLTALLRGEHAQLHDRLGGAADPGARAGAVLLAPIRIRNRALGTLGLVSSEPERYGPAEIALAEELGRRAGVAIENAQLYTAAQNAAKLAEEASRAKDEFLAIVSHELRTPLNAVLGWSTILRQRVTDPALAKPVEVIHRNAQAQASIIDDILDVSSVVTGKFQIDTKATDLVTIARDALEVVRPSSLAKKIELVFEPASGTCPLVADAERLQQVVWNLLSNAVKFTDAGGSVRLTLKQQGATVVLSVADTGRGIDPAVLPDVFDRFKQGDSSIRRRVGGLGLGLALVRHIVELHGGHVSAASAGIGHGATFTVVLPIRAVVARESHFAKPEPAVAPSNAQLLAGIRVLVVDDEPDARDLVATVLGEAGALVQVAGSASEGFAAVKRFRPEVLVSDIGMPGEDGYSLMERIRALTSEEGGRVASLALTAFAREEDRLRALRSGFTTHVGKPVNPDALTAAVANLADITRAR